MHFRRQTGQNRTEAKEEYVATCFLALTGFFNVSCITEKPLVATIGNVTITTVKIEKDQSIPCEDGELTDKDEAEGDDSDLDGEEESEEPPPQPPPPEEKQPRPPIKQYVVFLYTDWTIY